MTPLQGNLSMIFEILAIEFELEFCLSMKMCPPHLICERSNIVLCQHGKTQYG